jgi:hypothetical protein
VVLARNSMKPPVAFRSVRASPAAREPEEEVDAGGGQSHRLVAATAGRLGQRPCPTHITRLCASLQSCAARPIGAAARLPRDFHRVTCHRRMRPALYSRRRSVDSTQGSLAASANPLRAWPLPVHRPRRPHGQLRPQPQRAAARHWSLGLACGALRGRKEVRMVPRSPVASLGSPPPGEVPLRWRMRTALSRPRHPTLGRASSRRPGYLFDGSYLSVRPRGQPEGLS